MISSVLHIFFSLNTYEALYLHEILEHTVGHKMRDKNKNRLMIIIVLPQNNKEFL